MARNWVRNPEKEGFREGGPCLNSCIEISPQSLADSKTTHAQPEIPRSPGKSRMGEVRCRRLQHLPRTWRNPSGKRKNQSCQSRGTLVKHLGLLTEKPEVIALRAKTNLRTSCYVRPRVKDKTKMDPSQQNLEAGFHWVR